MNECAVKPDPCIDWCNETFVCHGRLRQINQFGRPLIIESWHWLASFLHNQICINKLCAASSVKLQELKKPHKAIYPLIHVFNLCSMTRNSASIQRLIQWIHTQYINILYLDPEKTQDQCVQPPALRCSINTFTQSFKSVREDRFRVIDDGWFL